MPKPLTTSFAQVYATVASDQMKRLGDAQAAIAGPPIGDPIAPATDADRVNAWNARDPKATDEAMLALARQKYQEHIQAGMPADVAQRATAEDLTHFRYGQRLKLYTYGQTDYAEQVAEAKRLAKLAARKTTPDPPMPPPTMPTAALTNLTTMGAPLPPGQPPSITPPPDQQLTTMPGGPMSAPGLPEQPLNGTSSSTTPGGY